MGKPNIIVIEDDYPKFQILDKPAKTVAVSKVSAVMEQGEAADILRHLEEATAEEERADAEAERRYEAGEDIREIDVDVDEAKLDEADRLFQSVFNRVAAVNDALWQPEQMHASEYERGGFQSHVASRLIDSSLLVTTAITVDVNTKILPNREEQKRIKALFLKDGENVKTVREAFAEAGADIPETIPVKVYIVAPKDKLEETIDMVKAFAAQSEESMTHRGLYFNESVAYQSLGKNDQEKIDRPESVGWYEIESGVFFTIDKSMFDRVKAAFVSQKPKAPAAPQA